MSVLCLLSMLSIALDSPSYLRAVHLRPSLHQVSYGGDAGRGECPSMELEFWRVLEPRETVPACPTGKVTAATHCLQDRYYPTHTDMHRATISSFFPLTPAVLSAVPRHSAVSAEVFTQIQLWKPQLHLHPRVTPHKVLCSECRPLHATEGQGEWLFKLKMTSG